MHQKNTKLAGFMTEILGTVIYVALLLVISFVIVR